MKLCVAACQMQITQSKEENLKTAESMIRKSADEGANLVVLPEMFICPYDMVHFSEYAETAEGPTTERMRNLAGELGIILVAGSLPEIEHDKIYNTAFVFNEKSECIGKHRKNHLFDIRLGEGFSFTESAYLHPGNQRTIIPTPFGLLGIAICFDLRFPEMFVQMALAGASLMVVPANFSLPTGRVHWELALRSRAVDSQSFVLACSSARNEKGFQAYGHSALVDPWGKVLCELDEKSGLFIKEIDLELASTIREELPILSARKNNP